jgi:hypothetical protein
MRHRSPLAAPPDWHPALRALIESADQECPAGHAQALRVLMALALRKTPSRGVFDPAVRGEEDLFAAIENVAQRYLDLPEARKAWNKAARAAALTTDQREDLEQAVLQLQMASDSAYFYAGLAFGLAYAYANRAA